MSLDYAVGRKRWFERETRFARWGRRFAFFSVPVLLISVGLHRFGQIDTPTLINLAGLSFGFALMGFIAALFAFYRIWVDGLKGWANMFSGLIIGGAVLAVPALAVAVTFRLPMVNDVTTDTASPPAFEALAGARRMAGAHITYPGSEAAAIQREAHPKLQPLILRLPADKALGIVVAEMEEKGWELTDKIDLPGQYPDYSSRQPDAVPLPVPDPRREIMRRSLTIEGDLVVEAVVTTLVVGFKDDVVVRITPRPDGSRIDMRSASRYGRHDMGANARRIQAFFRVLEEKTREARRI